MQPAAGSCFAVEVPLVDSCSAQCRHRSDWSLGWNPVFALHLVRVQYNIRERWGQTRKSFPLIKLLKCCLETSDNVLRRFYLFYSATVHSFSEVESFTFSLIAVAHLTVTLWWSLPRPLVRRERGVQLSATPGLCLRDWRSFWNRRLNTREPTKYGSFCFCFFGKSGQIILVLLWPDFRLLLWVLLRYTRLSWHRTGDEDVNCMLSIILR